MSTPIPATALTAFAKFIQARERHRVGRETGNPVKNPDPIISQYRFCNVRRNDDRVTKWVMDNVVSPHRADRDLWFRLVVARLFNLPETLALLERQKCVAPFKPDRMRAALYLRKLDGLNIFNAAYIVSTNGRAMDKIDYVVDHILIPAWDNRDLMRVAARMKTLEGLHQQLMTLNGMASFMSAQVVADLKYAHPAQWRDFDTFAASGPGSRRGLNRVLGRDKDAAMPEAAFRETLDRLRRATNNRLKLKNPITAQDIQNCLCEYDKYERARSGEGRPKQKYSRPALPWKD